MKDEFLVVTRIKKTIVFMEKILINFPKKDLEIKKIIKSTMYELLELVYLANINENSIREQYQKQALVKIKMIDFFIKISYDNEIINKKKYETIGKHLLEITKILRSWINHEKNKQQL